MTASHTPPRVKYLPATPKDLPWLLVAHALTKQADTTKQLYRKVFHFTDTDKKTGEVRDITVMVLRSGEVKKILSLSGGFFLTVPVRSTDLSLGITTSIPTPRPLPLSSEAATVISNADPLAAARLSGSVVTYAQLTQVVERCEADSLPPVRDGEAVADSPLVKVLSSAYDSMTHPGDLSWHSDDGHKVLSWWAAGRYALGMQMSAGFPATYGPNVDSCGVRSSSPLSTVLDGSPPAAAADEGWAVEGYRHGRPVPPYMPYGVWLGGEVLLKDAPGLAHAVYGDYLYTLWGDLLDWGTTVMIRPYVRVTSLVEGDVRVVRQHAVVTSPASGVSTGLSGSDGFVSGVFLLQSGYVNNYHFYGFFDGGEVPRLRLYGVNSRTGGVATNGFYEGNVPSVPDVPGDVVLTLTVPGSTRVQTRTETFSSPAYSQPLTTDTVTFGAKEIYRTDSRAYFFSQEWWVESWPRIYVEGEALTRTPLTQTVSTVTLVRVDTELMPYVDHTAEGVAYGTATSTSQTTYKITTEKYREVGTRRGCWYYQANYYAGADKWKNGVLQTSASPPAAGTRTTITIRTSYCDRDGNLISPFVDEVLSIPVVVFHGVYSRRAQLTAAMSAGHWEGIYPDDMGGLSDTGSLYGWYDAHVYFKVRVLGRSLDLALGYLAGIEKVITSAYNIGSQFEFGYAPPPGIQLVPILAGANETVNYGVPPLARSDFDVERYFYETTTDARLSTIEIKFADMEHRVYNDVYVGYQRTSLWKDIDGSTITERSSSETRFTVTAVNDIVGYGDPRWPVANQFSVAPWQCYDSFGGVWHPGTYTQVTTNGVAGPATATEIVFDPAESLLSGFRTQALDAPVATNSYQNTQGSRSDTPDATTYLTRFREATEVRLGVDVFPGVPTERYHLEGTYPIAAPTHRGLEYYYKYDITTGNDVLFGLPYGEVNEATYRPMVWYKVAGDGISQNIRIAVDGMYDDKVIYNSPIFIKGFKRKKKE